MPPAGLGKGMLNWSGKVRLGKVVSSCKNKYCHNVLIFSQGSLKFSCAEKNCVIAEESINIYVLNFPDIT